MTIGERAAKLVKERAWANGTTFVQECEVLGVWYSNLRSWSTGLSDPRADTLASMYNAGYDVIWILTGKESNNGRTVRT